MRAFIFAGHVLFLALLLITSSGCSTANPTAARHSIRLTATLTSPTDVALHWNDPEAHAAGHIVEFTTDPQMEYVILGFVPRGQNTFAHSRLMPETTFYYRVRAYSGPASPPVAIQLPKELSDADYAERFAKAEDFSWANPQTIPTGPAEIFSVRDPCTTAKAAPTDLKAELVSSTVSGVKLRWTNHAANADGDLLEMKSENNSDFSVSALIAPDVNSFGWTLEPPVRQAAFRIRAFYYGPPSNIARATTGKSAAP